MLFWLMEPGIFFRVKSNTVRLLASITDLDGPANDLKTGPGTTIF
jgi:hypothetical protein